MSIKRKYIHPEQQPKTLPKLVCIASLTFFQGMVKDLRSILQYAVKKIPAPHKVKLYNCQVFATASYFTQNLYPGAIIPSLKMIVRT